MFEEAVFGVKKEVSFNKIGKCTECGGSGAEKGTEPKTCPNCRGSGTVRVQTRSPFGMIQTSKTCDTCRGKGKIVEKPCPSCRGNGFVRIPKKLEVSIPAGIDDGQTIALRGQGSEGQNGGAPGNLNIIVNVRPHPFFEREGYDIHCDVPITFAEATLGAVIEIPTLEGKEKFTIPEATQTGTTFTLRGRGIQRVNSKSRGNLYLTVNVEVPKNLNSNQKELLSKFADACGEKNYTKKSKFFKKDK